MHVGNMQACTLRERTCIISILHGCMHDAVAVADSTVPDVSIWSDYYLIVLSFGKSDET